MGPPRALLDLQSLDSAIDRLTARRRALEAGESLKMARREADAAENELGELRLQLDAMDRDGSRIEHEIDSLQQKSAAEDQRLYDGSVANPKELDSIRHEVENLKRRKADREDELLAFMEQREELESRANEAGRRAAELRARVDHVAADAERELEEVLAELGARTEERRSLAPSIDPDLLELYDDLRASKKGVGAAGLVDGVCQGCHETLSSVELDHVRRSDDVPRCEHCRRILVL
jgi:uncharacterized protein